MNEHASRGPIGAVVGASLAVVCIAGLLGGCGGGPAADSPASGASNKVRIGYLGLTCEAAMFAAFENGYFKEEGLDVEFVKTDWDSLRDGLGLGRFDANYHLVMYLLKPIEKGLDVKLTGGVHSGCLRLQAGVKSDIKTVADVKGKRIGVPTAIGSPPFLFSSRVLKAAGMDPAKDVEWVAMAPDVLGLALDNGQLDGVCTAEPIGTILLAQDKVRTIADSAVDEPYKSEYCCSVVVSGAMARNDPEKAAKVTRALLKGAAWVDVNPTAAARISVEKKYVASSVELNARAVEQLHFAPGVSGCRESVAQASREMQAIGLLDASTDPAELAKTAWLDLGGVTDDWIKGLKIEPIAGGGPQSPITREGLAALFASDKDFQVLCDRCLSGSGDLCGE